MAGSAPRLHYFLVVVLPLAVYALSLGNGFHYDDGHSILRNPHIRSLEGLPAFFSDPTTFSGNPDYAMYRPLVVSAHAFNFALDGYRPVGYIAFNLAIHLVNSVLVLLLLQRLGLSRGAALWGGLAFGLFPPHSEVVNYISSRSESLAALFVLAAFLAYLYSNEAKRLVYCSIGLFAAALLCKATALSLPLILAWYEYGFSSSKRRLAPLQRLVPFFILSLIYVVLYSTISPASVGTSFATRPWILHLATQTKALVHYLCLGIFPVHLNVHPQFFAADSVGDPAVVLAALILLSLGWLVYKKPAWRWGTGFALLCLSPTLVVPLNILVNDHRLYLASVGPIFLAARLSPPPTRWMGAALLLLFAGLAGQRSLDWRDETTLWRQAARFSPLMPEAQYNLGRALHQAENMAGARAAYERALALEPRYFLALANLGALSRQQGNPAEAVALLQRSLRLMPDSVEALNNLGLAYADLGQAEAAIQAYRQAIDLDKGRGEIWYNLGLALRDAGRLDEARDSLIRALALEPELKNRFTPK